MSQRQGLQQNQQQQQVQNTSSAQVLLSTIVEMPLAFTTSITGISSILDT